MYKMYINFFLLHKFYFYIYEIFLFYSLTLNSFLLLEAIIAEVYPVIGPIKIDLVVTE